MILGFIPHALLVLTYSWHGIGALTMGEEYTMTIAVLSLNEMTNTRLLICVGLLDFSVAIFLIFKDFLLPKLRWILLLLYIGLYPIIPRVLQWMGGDGFAWIEILIFATLAFLAAYNLHVYKDKRKMVIT